MAGNGTNIGAPVLRFTRLVAALAFLAAVLVATSASPSLAQSTDPSSYDRVIDAAVAEFGAGQWAEARALFLEAHALQPNARTLRGIGMSSYELRDYPEAVRALDESLRSTVRPLTDEQRAQVTELRERAAAFVGRYEVPAAPAGARFYVDGERVTPDGGWPDAPGHVLLGVGDHQIAIRLDDGRATSGRVVVRGHTDGVIDLDRAPLAPATASAPPPDAAPPPSYAPVPPAPSGGSDATPWIVAGVGAGVAVVGAILVGVGYADIATVEHASHGTPWSSLQAAYDRGPIETGVGGAALGVGLAAALVGVVWGIAQAPPTSARDEQLVVDVGWGTLGVHGVY